MLPSLVKIITVQAYFLCPLNLSIENISDLSSGVNVTNYTLLFFWLKKFRAKDFNVIIIHLKPKYTKNPEEGIINTIICGGDTDPMVQKPAKLSTLFTRSKTKSPEF